MEVSIYKNVSDTKGTTGDLFEFLTGEGNRSIVERIRKTDGPEERNRLKKQLPCCTPSGVFSTRSKNGLSRHSGFICIDIDGDDNPRVNDWEAFSRQLGNFVEVALSMASVSGNGAFCLIRVSDPTQHERHFKAIEEDFARWGITIDPSCIDVCRLRFISFQNDPYVNKDAEVYTRLSGKSKRRTQERPRGEADPVKLAEVRRWASIAETERIDVTGDYGTWFSLACSLAFEFGSEGRDLFHQFSRIYGDYSERETDGKYDDAMRAVRTNDVMHPTYNRIREICTKHGITAIDDFK